MRNDIINFEQKHFLNTYKRLPIVVDYAYGTRIFDVNGKSYLDMLGGIAVNILGHSHPKILAAIDDQIRRFMHLSNYFYQTPQIELAKKLLEMSGFDRVFFSNSGTESIEAALKLARRWGNKNNKKEIIGFTGGFHGRTYGALSIMDKPNYKNMMEPYLGGTKILNYNDVQNLGENINENTAAVFLEFVQGEGGLQKADSNFIQKLFELKDKYNFIIVADEIQSGIGRTGKFLAFEHYNVKPDIVTLSKGLGGGLPLGCILVDEQYANIFEPGMHGTTFGGNPVSAAAGLVVLEELSHGLVGYVDSISKLLNEKLNDIQAKYDIVTEVRGIGLMTGIVVDFDASIIVDNLLQKGIITNVASNNVLRLVPPFIIQQFEVELFYQKLCEVLDEINTKK